MVHDLILPKMGESITEATILRWLYKEGDKVTQDTPVLEIATDKVDSEILAPASGILTNIRYKENEVAPIGALMARIAEHQTEINDLPVQDELINSNNAELIDDTTIQTVESDMIGTAVPFVPQHLHIDSTEGSTVNKFYSPLVKTIAREENISGQELDSIIGSGVDGRVTKSDVLSFLSNKNKQSSNSPLDKLSSGPPPSNTEIEIIEMDRMRRLIADHMVNSKHTAPHVTSFIEVDVTNLVLWRNKIKNAFQEKYKQNITFTPLFIQAVVHAIKAYPLINSSVNGYQIIRKNNIHIGMATALNTGNLIVPVIKNAGNLNLAGLTFAVNDLASRARENKLKPEEVTEGTFTITNLGGFDSLTGTPIINQPQVAILATGVIKKKPVVIETPTGDSIGIRHIMIASMAYDHRVIDGYLGGMFLKKFAQILEHFDVHTAI